MFRITHQITIGKFKFPSVNGIEVLHSMKNLTATAVISLPRNIWYNGKKIEELIVQGDRVTAEAGYNDINHTLFTGYVRKMSYKTPLQIMCENEMYALKSIMVNAEHFPNLSLQSFLKSYLPGNIKTNDLDINLGQFRIRESVSLSKILNYISEEYAINFFFKGDTLYKVLPSTDMVGNNEASLHNIDASRVKSDDIEYRDNEDINIIIKVKTILPDNTKLEVQEPKELKQGETHTFIALDKKTEKELREYAKDLLVKFKPGNLKGTITLFGEPFVEPGDFVKISNSLNTPVNGKICQVSEVKYLFSNTGLSQTLTIGRSN